MRRPSMRTKGSLCLTLGVLVAVWGLFAPSALAYHLEGLTWANQPPSGQCCANLAVQYSGIHYGSDYAVWDNGLNAWTDDPAALISFYVASSGNIHLYDTSDSSVSWDGITYENDFLGHFLATQSYLNYYYVKNDSAGEAQGIATHELGHVAGLAHTNGCVIMTPTTYTRWGQCGIDTPQQDDANGINAMY
ncbi:MAG TPA: matrixin family metalloprotease [Ktedonobacterales bacterium]|nr:matrixin family metalloprotease [Ktedonobacterales bacterium]